jgi:hypothetical protein
MKANQTRWSEKWHTGGGMQAVKCRVMETRNYDEYIIVTLRPIEIADAVVTAPRNSTGGSGLLVEDSVGKLAQQLKSGALWK